ncbi:ATP-dependent helicase, partial [Desulfovirgula thermocuniculi]|uniref:ATP-dependent helicase n=1 Tax=Desulfovirgula thermocuniculi TaxID=348842 RepID=UPI00146FA07F
EILSLRERLGLPWGSFAVLYRRNAMSGEFERALARRGVPYEVVGSVSFWKRKEVKDALAFLRVAVNPRDAVSLERVCRLLPGVGEGRAKEAAGFCFGGLPAWDALREVAGKKGVRKKAREALLGLAGLLLALEAGVRAGENAGELLRKALEGSGYLAALERDATEEGRERLENVAVLVSAAAEVGSVDELLSRAALESGDGEEGGSRRDAVRLMTLHRAKGLEFPVVFLVGAEEGGLPDYRNAGGPPLEEERRLFFVGMTRAMDFLYVTRAECRGLWGRGQRRPPSRFIAEAGLEEVRALPGRTAPGRADCHGRLERPDPRRLAAFRAV